MATGDPDVRNQKQEELPLRHFLGVLEGLELVWPPRNQSKAWP